MIPVHKLQKSMILYVRATFYVMMAMISCLDNLFILLRNRFELTYYLWN